MILTKRQRDRLEGLINTAFGRTSAALSELAGHRVTMGLPEVAVVPTADLYPTLSQFVPRDATSVHQAFSGPLSGDAILLMNYEGAAELARLLTDRISPASELDESARDALTEVGNILLNTCLGMFGILLDVHLYFSLPQLHLATVKELLDSLLLDVLPDQDSRPYALLVCAAFQINDSEVQGYLIMVLSVATLDRLLHEVETWEVREENPELKDRKLI